VFVCLFVCLFPACEWNADWHTRLALCTAANLLWGELRCHALFGSLAFRLLSLFLGGELGLLALLKLLLSLLHFVLKVADG
jgi:hypothetical protein